MIVKFKATNFLSWENLEFNFTNGVTLISGFNNDDQSPEGSGKSAIPNALCWGLYGKIPKDAKIDDVIRYGAKSCSVVVDLETGLKIVRTRKPNDLYIEQDGKIIKGKDANETQELIEFHLGMSFDAFVQAVYFAQNYPKKFITSTQEEKGKILSDIQDLNVFDEARKKILSELREQSVELARLKAQTDSAVEKTQSIDEHISDLEVMKHAFKTEKNNNLKIVNDQIAESVAELDKLQITKTQLKDKDFSENQKKIDKDLEELSNVRAELQHKLVSIEDVKKQKNKLSIEMNSLATKSMNVNTKVNSYKNAEVKSCELCGSSLDKADPAHIEKHVKELKKELKELNAKIKDLALEDKDLIVLDSTDLRMDINELIKATNALKDLKRELDREALQKELIDQKIEMQEKEIKRLKQTLDKEASRTSEPIDKRINIAREDLKQKKLEAEAFLKVLKEREDYVLSLERLKSGFKEVKSYIFQSLLLELTNKSNKYLKQLFELPISIKFTNTSESGDMTKILTDVTLDGVERPLGLYSGGQFRRIQLAVDLALSEIISSRSNKPMKIRIFDEYMKDLSLNSMQKILRLLEGLKGSTILIEHNDIFKTIVQKEFKVELTDGVSRTT